jgi:hypothetical protein
MNALAKTTEGLDKLFRVLTEQYRTLSAAQADQEVLSKYNALIRFLRKASDKELHRIFGHAAPAADKAGSGRRAPIPDAEIANMTLSDVEKIINDESATRKDLERVAVYRFHVPAGSMRSFPNRDRLISKLLTFLRNEQAHRTIESVTRGQGELPGVGERSKEKAG